MNQEFEKAKEAHQKNRQGIEEKLTAKPLRNIDSAPNPTSSDVVIDRALWDRYFAKMCLFTTMFLAICATTVSIALAYVASKDVETLSYLSDEDGRIVLLRSEKDPTLTQAEILGWAAKKARKLNNLSFTDYNNQVELLRFDFTETAYEQYKKALVSSKSIKKVKNGRLNMWIEPLEAPKIVKAKLVGGKMTWVVQYKVVQQFGGGEYVTSGTNMLVTMVIERVTRSKNLAGIVISKYLAKEIN